MASTQDLVTFLIAQISRGAIQAQGDLGPTGACSSFTAQAANGDRLFARNFDMDAPTPLAVVYTRPEDGRYRSVSTVNLAYVGLGEAGIQSFADGMAALASVYVPMDGMNEKGLAVAVHMSYQGPGEESVPTDLQTGQLGVTSASLLRLFLDYAADVDEAVAIAKEVDLHDDIGSSMHYFIADASGRSAVLHWTGETGY